MEKTILTFFQNHQLPLEDKKLVVAVSTGMDSMSLLNALLELKKSIYFDLVVAHVHHGKRVESDMEETFIKEYCNQKELMCYLKRLDLSANRENFQKEAREQRYRFFEEVMQTTHADYLVLAHHANDQMETIMMRILRGSNLSGYAGMKDKVYYHPYWILRPLLQFNKRTIEAYAKTKNISYFEDASNKSDTYTRNRVRKSIIQSIENEFPEAHVKFQEFSEIVTQAKRLIDQLVDRFISESVRLENNISFHRSDFEQLDEALQIEVLFTLLEKYQLSKANILEIIKQIKSDKANILSIIRKRMTFVKEYSVITFYDGVIQNKSVYLEIDEIKSYTLYDNMSICVVKKSSNSVTNLTEIWYNSIQLPVVVRSRKPGDRILLNAGYKKVKDILIDRKIGRVERDKIVVIEDQQKEILAILGVEKSKKLEEITTCDIVIKMEEQV
jgi:tRNA(Ile)-lysidine synthetase-like protein